MYKSYFNQNENQNCVMEPDALSVFQKEKNAPSQIRQGMPQNQIAEIVSDKLIDYIKNQFEAVKKLNPKDK
ncbi:MAG: hypothetical protein K9H26_06435 [Prolixibacteraceae bacterium]|nr:hypothetical protein [Prolixibacteraceae bacterium]